MDHPRWREQYERVKRWRARLSEAKRPDEVAAEHELRLLDSTRVFFVECHHLGEWVGNDPTTTVTSTDVKNLRQSTYEWLWRCGAIADGVKHAIIAKGRARTAEGFLLTENGDRLVTEAGEGIRLEGIFVVDSHGREWLAVDAADACLAEWDRILGEIGLLQGGSE